MLAGLRPVTTRHNWSHMVTYGRIRSHPAEHGDDAAEDGRLVTGNRGVGGVVRHQPHVAARALERLYRGLALDHRRHYLAVLGDGLLPHHDPVAVRDGSVDH